MESIRVLVVEDDPDINSLLCTILRDGGYQSQSAYSGSEGVLWAEGLGTDRRAAPGPHSRRVALIRIEEDFG